MTADRSPLTALAEFDEIIDVRSPAEFAEDHIPGAINCPVLDDAQRIEVGTLYKQVSPFEAKKIGAALVSENIGRHLRERFLEQGARLETADLLLARRQPQRLDDHRLPRHRLEGEPARRRLQDLAQPRRRAAQRPAAGFPLPRHLRRHRQRQDAHPAGHRRPGRTGARPRNAGQPQGLRSRRPARPAAAGPEMVRNAVAAGTGTLRPGAAGLCRGGKPQDRPAACTRDADRTHPRRRMPECRCHAGGARRLPARRLRLFPDHAGAADGTSRRAPEPAQPGDDDAAGRN